MTASGPPANQHIPIWRVESERTLRLDDGRAVVLRPLAVADADLMAEFLASLTEREIYYFFRLDEDAARGLALNVEADPAFRLVAVGEHGGVQRILGYEFLLWNDSDAPIFGVCIREGAQSAGLGRAMIDYFLMSAADSGVGLVRLRVHPDNWRALRLYQRVGFRIVDEFINEHQGVKQYRMRADLQLSRPTIADNVTIIPHGGLGIGLAAARVHAALDATMGRRPLILDRPSTADGKVIFVVDLGPSTILPFAAATPTKSLAPDGDGWVMNFDEDHFFIGGVGMRKVDRAVERYIALLGAGNVWPSEPL